MLGVPPAGHRENWALLPPTSSLSSLMCILSFYLRHVLKVSKTLIIDLPYDPAIPLLGIYLMRIKSLNVKDFCALIFNSLIFTIAKTWKQHKYPLVDKQIYNVI